MALITKDLFQYTSPNGSPGFQLWQVYGLWHRTVNKALASCQLTHAQFLLLASLQHLSSVNKAVTQVDLSNHATLDAMSTSKALRLLAGKLLIERNASATDQRSKAISITPEGEKVLKTATKLLTKAEVEFFSALRKEKHLSKFSEYLKEIIDYTDSSESKENQTVD
ncbi:MAG: MarR family winged helix-turn-helix transcriptional regulator [Flexibacteraceae bacterium]